MKWLGDKLGFNKPEDWYKISLNDFYSNKGRGLVKYYQESPSVAVKEYLPDYDWIEWLFGKVPLSFWKKPENRSRYMKWLGGRLGFEKPEDWYQISQKDFSSNKGHGFLTYCQDSPSAAIMEYFPDYDWKEWLFEMSPLGFWDKPDNRYRYMRWLGNKLDFKKPEDWYRITQKDFKHNKGGGLLACCYRSSPSMAVMEYLPDYDWKEWLFRSTPKNFWNAPENHHRYMKWLEDKLEIEKPEDWYTVTKKDFDSNKGSGFLQLHYRSSPSVAIMAYNPDYDWQPEKFSFRMKQQKRLYRIIKRIFNNHEIQWNFKHSEIRFSQTQRSMELDIFISSLRLAIEYQGEQHFFPVSSWGGIPALNRLRQRDEEKRKACKTHEINLVEVSYDWDGSEGSVIEILSKQFVKQIHKGGEGIEQLRTALKVISTYNKKQQSQ
jgi:hypothetical protein